MHELSRFKQFCVEAEDRGSGKDESHGLSSGALKTFIKILSNASFEFSIECLDLEKGFPWFHRHF